MKKITSYIFSLAVCCLVSCNKTDRIDAQEALAEPVIAGFPAFEEDGGTTKTVGTAETGKTAWTQGDTVYLFASRESSMESATMFTMVNDGTKWNLSPASEWGSFASGEVYYDAMYAPAYTTKGGALALRDGKADGQEEFLRSSGKWGSGTHKIAFKRDYSRIRVSAAPGSKAVMSCSGFVPVGLAPKALADSCLTGVANAAGNVCFYGRMESSSRIVITLYEGNAATSTCFLDGKTLVDGKSYAVSPAAKSRTIKILAIGNSFSADAVEQELYGLFASINQPVIIGDAYIAGCPLVTHAANAKSNSASYSYRKTTDGTWTKTAGQTLLSIINDEDWDYISLQEGAGFHGFYNQTYQGTTHSMEPDLTYMINYVKEKCPGSKIVYHACWAAQKGYTGVKFSYYGYDQTVMYNMIAGASKEVLAAHPEIDIYINTVDAIQNLRTSFIGDNVQRDGWHLNYSVGRYTASCIWFEKIMGRSVMGNTYRCATICESRARLCQTAAHQACLNPGKVTDLSYIKPGPDEPEEQPKTVLAKWKFTPANAVSDGYIKTWCGQTAVGVYSYSNKPGETGYILANDGGSGKLSYVQIDKTQWTASDEMAGKSIFDVSNGGQPVSCGTMAGDCWLFETTGKYDIPEGSKIRCVFTITPSKYGQKYWLLEYKDGTEWKPAFPVSTVDISLSGEKGVKYNMALTKEKIESYEFTTVLENSMTDFAFRLTCSSEYQVNDKWFSHPRTASSYRIAGDPANEAKPCPEIDLLLY